MVYHRISGSILPESTGENLPRRRRNILATLEYPLIICNNFENFLRTEVDSNDDPVLIENNFQLEVNYAYMDTNKNQRSEFFLIDVLDFNKLDDFLDIILNDVRSIANVIGNWKDDKYIHSAQLKLCLPVQPVHRNMRRE